MVILVVEDDVLIGLALQVVLYLGGHRVVGPAVYVDEALRLADAEPPELAFVDINIGGDGDGIAVARALTQRHGTSCIFLTAQLAQARSARDVAVGVIAKPYDPPELLRAVKVVAALRKGKPPPTVPRYLELFD